MALRLEGGLIPAHGFGNIRIIENKIEWRTSIRTRFRGWLDGDNEKQITSIEASMTCSFLMEAGWY